MFNTNTIRDRGTCLFSVDNSKCVVELGMKMQDEELFMKNASKKAGFFRPFPPSVCGI